MAGEGEVMAILARTIGVLGIASLSFVCRFDHGWLLTVDLLCMAGFAFYLIVPPHTTGEVREMSAVIPAETQSRTFPERCTVQVNLFNKADEWVAAVYGFGEDIQHVLSLIDNRRISIIVKDAPSLSP